MNVCKFIAERFIHLLSERNECLTDYSVNEHGYTVGGGYTRKGGLV
jgi:hypothetical protein